MNDATIRQVADWLRSAHHVVAFTGAGISTESGIPDYRSPGGIWATSRPVYFDEFLASRDARYEYWRQKSVSHRDFVSADPNTGHRTLAQWETAGRLACVVTQNIDGLHQLAGSSRVLELHGTARFVACLQCEARYEAEIMVSRFLAENEPPDCPECGGLMKHATVSFGQNLPPSVLENAISQSQMADLFLALGSSLVVQPAASLPALARERGARLVIINREPTPLDRIADAVLHAPIGATLQAIHASLSDENARV